MAADAGVHDIATRRVRADPRPRSERKDGDP
jgi:hypothetical protein